MRRMTKVLALAACAGLLVIGTAIGTMAYLTHQESSQTTFTVGETRVRLNAGEVEQPAGLLAEEKASFKLVPGQSYSKDVSITVGQGSEDCYLFACVQDGIAHLEAEGEQTPSIAQQLAANGWLPLEGVADVYYYCGISDTIQPVSVGFADVTVQLFTGFTLDGNKATNEALDALLDENGKVTASLKVTAYSVQALGFEDAAPQQIWAAGNWTVQAED